TEPSWHLGRGCERSVRWLLCALGYASTDALPRVLVAAFVSSRPASRSAAPGRWSPAIKEERPRLGSRPSRKGKRDHDIRGGVKALRENEVVLHLADHHDYLPSFSKLFHINAVGTAILFELLLEGKTSVRRVVLGSSMAVYGEGRYRCGKDGDVYPQPRRVDALERGVWDPPCPICGGATTPMVTDESVARPTSAYGLSKLAQEELVRLLGERHGIEWIILRYGAVQGREQPFQNAYYGALRIFALRLAHNQPPLLLEDGNQLR